MKLKEIKAIAEELDWVEPSHGLALITIVEELRKELADEQGRDTGGPRFMDYTQGDEIITRHLEPLK